MPAKPHTLCASCTQTLTYFRPSLSLPPPVSKLAVHYRSIQDLVAGTTSSPQCHLCAIIGGWYTLAIHTSTLDSALLKTGKSTRKDALVTTLKDAQLQPTEPEGGGGKQAWRTFELVTGYAEDDGVLDVVGRVVLRCLTEGVPRGRITPAMLSVSAGSEESIALLRRWLGVCRAEHAACRPDGDARRPTRLLDLYPDGLQGDGEGGGKVRLVRGEDVGGAAYAALSYCWGAVPQLMLLRRNYADFERGIELSSCTVVARDAILVCQKLGVRYLWIDAMCIVQGSDGDFAEEAGRMEDVYANAVFTVTAAACSDTSQSFLVPREPLAYVDCHLWRTEDGTYRSYIEGNDFCSTGYNVPGTFALDTRGWCFQEQFLSPRSIYFGASGVHWNCRAGIACEHADAISPAHAGNSGDEELKTMYTALTSLKDDLSDPPTFYSLRSLWSSVLSRYSGTQLTHSSDRLVALAGIASIIERKFKVDSAFGLWRDFFLDEVLWITADWGGDESRRLGIAPSWSWTNVVGRSIFSGNTLYPGEVGEEYMLVEAYAATLISLPCAAGFTTILHPFVAGNESTVRLRGKLVRCASRQDESRGRVTLHRFESSMDAPRKRGDIGTYFPDLLTEPSDMYCFLIRRQLLRNMDPEQPRTIQDHCLVLSPVGSPPSRFQRCGVYIESMRLTDTNQPVGETELQEINMLLFRSTDPETDIEIV